MNKRVSTVFGILLFSIIGIAGYVAIGDLVGSQSQQHQQSVSPIFGLIEKELVEPLHIATTLDKIGVYKDYFIADNPDQETLVTQLKDYSDRLDLVFYVAHEKSRKQYNSDGRVFDLIEDDVIWYFALKDETDYKVQAVLGKREDVHLYIDVRQYNAAGEFVGFIGLGKSLDDFIDSFEQFKNNNGHEFIFVNNRDEIVLSSIPTLLPASPDSSDDVISITSISSLPWYSNFAQQTKGQIDPSLVVSSRDGDLLISQLNIESLHWSIYLLTPLSDRQEEVSTSFVLYSGLGLLILLILYQLVFSIVDFYADKMNRKFNCDPLTKLANRRYASLFFSRQRRRYRTAATIMIDIDNYKQINHDHGHNAIDLLVKQVAKTLLKTVRENDLVVRWGGEKFVVLLANVEHKEALELAELCRTVVQDTQIEVANTVVNTTVNVGVAYSRDFNDSIALMVEWAEQSMYKAKREGKNRVVVRDVSYGS
jgi:diguanylate cyclase (GGDEF)-like protein